MVRLALREPREDVERVREDRAVDVHDEPVEGLVPEGGEREEGGGVAVREDEFEV